MRAQVISLEGSSPVLSFTSRESWASWLEKNHANSAGIWLKLAKRTSGIDSVSYPEALEVALCYGWIDGQTNRLDADYWLKRFTPRLPRGRWSKINRDKAAQLIASGQMKPAGLREVERARADGRWDAAYEGPRTATVPEDLQRELSKNAKARAFFGTLNSQNRYAILYRIQDAKRSETRAARIKKFVAMLSQHKTIHPER